MFLSGLLGLFGCGGSKEKVHVRIQNNSGQEITQFWLGTGSGSGGSRSRSYGQIAAGSVTGYKALEPSFAAYGKFNFIAADGRKYLGSTFPTEEIGRRELSPGYYTFAVTTVGDTAVLRIISDPPPR